MRALRKMSEAPGLELCDIPEPTPGFGEVKIRVQRAGLCGTDVHLYTWDGVAPGSLTPPQTLGHKGLRLSLHISDLRMIENIAGKSPVSIFRATQIGRASCRERV